LHDLSKENKTSYIGYLGCSLATQTLFEINSRFYAFTRDEKTQDRIPIVGERTKDVI